MEKTYLYVLEEDVAFFKNYKIGVSSNLQTRIRNIQYRTPGKTVLKFKRDFPCYEDAIEIELAVHHRLTAYRLPKRSHRGREWYRIDLQTILDAISTYMNPKARRFPRVIHTYQDEVKMHACKQF